MCICTVQCLHFSGNFSQADFFRLVDTSDIEKLLKACNSGGAILEDKRATYVCAQVGGNICPYNQSSG